MNYNMVDVFLGKYVFFAGFFPDNSSTGRSKVGGGLGLGSGLGFGVGFTAFCPKTLLVIPEPHTVHTRFFFLYCILYVYLHA